jgi:hypothetical protein
VLTSIILQTLRKNRGMPKKEITPTPFSLNAAWQGAFTAGLFGVIGNKMTAGQGVIAHGIVGGAVAEANGGEFGAGFALGVFNASTAGGGKYYSSRAEAITVSAILGGMGSNMGGGSLESGAVTGAFAGLYAGLQEEAQSGSGGSSTGQSDRAARLREALAVWAENQFGSEEWAYDVANPSGGGFPPSTNKCNLFLYDGLQYAGIPAPMQEPGGKWPLTAGAWATRPLKGWIFVSTPQRGDAVAWRNPHGGIGATGHDGIVTDVGKKGWTASAAHGSVTFSHFGFDSSTRTYVFRRYIGVQ